MSWRRRSSRLAAYACIRSTHSGASWRLRTCIRFRPASSDARDVPTGAAGCHWSLDLRSMQNTRRRSSASIPLSIGDGECSKGPAARSRRRTQTDCTRIGISCHAYETGDDWRLYNQTVAAESAVHRERCVAGRSAILSLSRLDDGTEAVPTLQPDSQLGAPSTDRASGREQVIRFITGCTEHSRARNSQPKPASRLPHAVSVSRLPLRDFALRAAGHECGCSRLTGRRLAATPREPSGFRGLSRGAGVR
jgi:hypothetical protein